jgi:hypothetical protein
MKRPYVPLKVRLAVLERQAFVDRMFENEEERQLAREWYELCCDEYTTRGKINWLLNILFFGMKAELDHDPALSLRKRRNGRLVPAANNPRYLIYREKDHHLQKTVGRKPGAERTVTTKGSDAWLSKKFRKLASPKESKSKIPARPFAGRKRPLRTRSSFATPAAKGS